MHNAPVKQKRTTMDNEIALIKLVKKGDKKAYNTLVLKYQDRLVFSIYKFLKDFELAQDIAQEAFIKDANPFDSLAWVINLRLSLNLNVPKGSKIITGSVIKTRSPKKGDVVTYNVSNLSETKIRLI